ncbi:MAG: tyrosine-protein phosphatase [Polyangiaceae bacterium]
MALVSQHPHLPWNFRDLGGAPVNGGRVASGRLFRTAHLSAIGEESAVHLQETLGVETYLDFRAEQDIVRDGAPQALLARGVRWQRHPFDISDGAFTALATPRPEDWRALYTRAFQRLRPELAGAVRLIALAEGPLAFGCWAGKDRTGIVAALTLSLLGVSDAWIAADFAQTGPSLLPAKDRFSFLWKDRPNAEAAIIHAHLRTEPESIVGFLSDVRQQFGSVSRALQLPESVEIALPARYIVPN